jgi:hypothetical protein
MVLATRIGASLSSPKLCRLVLSAGEGLPITRSPDRPILHQRPIFHSQNPAFRRQIGNPKDLIFLVKIS